MIPLLPRSTPYYPINILQYPITNDFIKILPNYYPMTNIPLQYPTTSHYGIWLTNQIPSHEFPWKNHCFITMIHPHFSELTSP